MAREVLRRPPLSHVVAQDVVDVSQRLDGILVGPACHQQLPLSIFDRVLAKLREVEDVAVQDDHVRLRTLGRIDEDSQEKWVDFLIVQIGSDQKRFEATGALAHVLVAPIFAARSQLAIMIHRHMLCDVALVLMLMSRKLDVCLALVLAEGAKVTAPKASRS